MEAVSIGYPGALVVHLDKEGVLCTIHGENQADIPVQSPDENITEIMSLNTEISRLDEKDRKMIELRVFRNMTQSETAKKLNMTQVQVSRREKKILLQLRERLI